MTLTVYAAVAGCSAVGLYALLGPAAFGASVLVLPVSLGSAAFAAYKAGWAGIHWAEKGPPSGGAGGAMGGPILVFLLAGVPTFVATFAFFQYNLTKMLL